jgi:hypothetical protein
VIRGQGGLSLRVCIALIVIGLVAFGCAGDGSAGPGPTQVTTPPGTADAPVRTVMPTGPVSTSAPAATAAAPTPPTAAPSQAGWYPAGFAVSPLDPTVAYRWMSKSQFRCDPAPVCWGLQVLARDGCESDLTIEVSLADSAGGALGTVFDTAGVVRAGQQATMVFEVETPGAQQAEITKLSCT